MAQGLIRPGSGPNWLPTLPSPTHARCSTAGRRVNHAAERALHCRRVSELHATRHPAPCASKYERPSARASPRSLSRSPRLSLALWPHQSSPTMAAVAEAPWPPRFSSGFSSGPTNLAYCFLHSRRTFPSSCFAGFAPAARRHRRRRRGCSWRAWPGHLESSPAKLRASVDARGPSNVAPPPHRHRRASSGRQQQAQRAPLF